MRFEGQRLILWIETIITSGLLRLYVLVIDMDQLSFGREGEGTHGFCSYVNTVSK